MNSEIVKVSVNQVPVPKVHVCNLHHHLDLGFAFCSGLTKRLVPCACAEGQTTLPEHPCPSLGRLTQRYNCPALCSFSWVWICLENHYVTTSWVESFNQSLFIIIIYINRNTLNSYNFVSVATLWEHLTSCFSTLACNARWWLEPGAFDGFAAAHRVSIRAPQVSLKLV